MNITRMRLKAPDSLDLVVLAEPKPICERWDSELSKYVPSTNESDTRYQILAVKDAEDNPSLIALKVTPKCLNKIKPIYYGINTTITAIPSEWVRPEGTIKYTKYESVVNPIQETIDPTDIEGLYSIYIRYKEGEESMAEYWDRVASNL